MRGIWSIVVLCCLHGVPAVKEDETIDEQLTEVLQDAGVEVSPVIEMKNGKFIFDLDEVMTPQQFNEIFGDDKTKRLNIRAAGIQSRRWKDKTVPYTLDHSYFDQDRKLVRDSMMELEKGTCIKFKRRTLEKNYVKFINDKGCYSGLGMVGGRQPISLAKRGCRYRETVLHEILHALGVIHEQQRPDRDNHVRLNTRNMIRGTESQFGKARSSSINYHGVPYDFSSIMHYSLKAFSRNRQRTIEPLHEKNAEKYIGRQLYLGLAFGDYKLLNYMYECAKGCNVDCPHPGYVTKECKCVQMPDFYKEHCKGNEKTGWCFKYNKGGGDTTVVSSCMEVDKRSDCKKYLDGKDCATNKYKKWMMSNCRKTCLCGEDDKQ